MKRETLKISKSFAKAERTNRILVNGIKKSVNDELSELKL